ncbi:MAG: peptidase S10 [Azospirillaceae bacterium]|nr:peptidase S10 [Azospirillaceae bacterium]
MRVSRLPLLALAITLGIAAPAFAQDAPVLSPVTLPGPVTVDHSGTFGGRKVAYQSVVEAIDVNDGAGKPDARLVATSYIAKGGMDARRPVLFVFNGGPIGASAPLHMGAFGPKRVAVPDDINADPSTFRLVDNVYTPLDVADVVVFDPANTGYSRTLPGVAPETQFSNVADARQLAQLVLAWRRIHGRPEAPVYLVGESYGTMRAVEAADQLQAAGDPVAGIFLLGQAVNIIEYAQRPNNIISYAVSLPTLAAVAWSHDKVARQGRTFEGFVKEAQAYGAGEYLTVLFQGDTAAPERMAAVAAKLQDFTGVPAAEFLKRRLKLTKNDFLRLLVPGQTLDSYDARYTVPAGQPMALYASRFEPEMVGYFQSFLKVPAAAGTYSLANPAEAAFESWEWAKNKTPFFDWPYVGQLKAMMDKNPKMRLYVANGYFDTQTTIGAMDYLASQSGLPRDRVRTADFAGGHMFYTVEASLKAFMDDVRRVVTAN